MNVHYQTNGHHWETIEAQGSTSITLDYRRPDEGEITVMVLGTVCNVDVTREGVVISVWPNDLDTPSAELRLTWAEAVALAQPLRSEVGPL